jgi:hypothetical protein
MKNGRKSSAVKGFENIDRPVGDSEVIGLGDGSTGRTWRRWPSYMLRHFDLKPGSHAQMSHKDTSSARGSLHKKLQISIYQVDRVVCDSLFS